MVAVLHDKVEGEAENIKVENIVRRAGATYNKPEPIKSRGGQVLVLGQVLIVKFPFSGSHTSTLPCPATKTPTLRHRQTECRRT